MKVPSKDIPQANALEEVIRTVISISRGGFSYQDIANSIGKVERQGRYYRKAAEIIGLIKTPQKNYSVLTPLGQQFIKSNPTISNPILLEGVLGSRIFQRIIPFLELKSSSGVTNAEFESFIRMVANLGKPSMAPRRISSVIRWLVDLGIVNHINNRYYLSNKDLNERLQAVKFNNSDEPLLPSANNLNEYNTVKQRSNEAKESLIAYRRSAASDRADNAHRELVNLTSKKIRESNGIPKYNLYIDLATHLNNEDYIFEMKSTTIKNERSQIRTGLSQLYEYRYLQNKPHAKLILVIENPLSKKENWREKYLKNDRDVYLVWDGNNELYGSEHIINELPFLNLTPSP